MFDSMLLTAHIFYGIDNSATLKHYLYKDNDFAHTKNNHKRLKQIYRTVKTQHNNYIKGKTLTYTRDLYRKSTATFDK